MSAFLVFLRFDGATVDPELPQKLGRLVAYRGPDGNGQINFPGCMMVHYLLRETRACKREKQPLLAADEHTAIVSDARLDDRHDLIRNICNAGLGASKETPTSQLLLDGYSIWGEGLLDRIAGDFSFIIVDRRRKRLLAARAPFGLRSLYIGQFDRGVILSNDPVPIMAHPKLDLRLDRAALGDFLLTGSVASIDPTFTPFTAIRQIASGSRLIVDMDSGHREIRKFWQFPMRSTPLYYRSLSDYGDHFREVLEAATKDRIDTDNVVAPMSGGMDSTTAVAIAAEIMAGGCGPERLTAVTAVRNEEDPEGILAAEVCRFLNVNHRIIQVQRGKPLESWRSTPFPNCNFYNSHERNLRLTAEIAPVSIDAASADYILAPERFTVLGQLRTSGLRDTWRALRVLKLEYGYRPPIGTGLYSRVRGNRAGEASTRAVYPSWFSADFEREFRLRDRWDRYWHSLPSPVHPLRPAAHRFIAARETLTMRSDGWPVNYAPTVSVDPFLDHRVIRFLWSLPPMPWFFKKHIVRTAMQGRLPASILQRPKTAAGKWVPLAADRDSNFAWQAGPVIADIVDVNRLPNLTPDQVEPADFHPLFLQKWLDFFPEDLAHFTGRNVQLHV